MLRYYKGDATNVQGKTETIFIPHVCNNVGKWGKGFVLALSDKWTAPRKEYSHFISKEKLRSKLQFGLAENKDLALGEIQIVQVEPNVYVVNMIAQRFEGAHPLVNEALEKCMIKVKNYINNNHKEDNVILQCPKFGAGLAGGDWATEIEPLIIKHWNDLNVEVYNYVK